MNARMSILDNTVQQLTTTKSTVFTTAEQWKLSTAINY
jgi:hypothetical protein